MEGHNHLYQSGFNDGYMVAKHDPDLAKLVTSRPNDQNDYFRGFVGGKEEYDREVQQWAKGFSRGQESRDDRSIDKDR